MAAKKQYCKVNKKCARKDALNIKNYLSLICKTIAAINRSIVSRLERDLATYSTRCACCVVHLSLLPSAAFTHVAAWFASLGLICKSLFGEKILFACRENEFLTTVFASNVFVLIQLEYLV